MRTILVVEDDLDIRDLLKELFEEEGWNVRCATSGLEVARAVTAFHPDVVLLDLVLPGRDGIDVLHDLRAHRSTAVLPVVVMTAACVDEIDLPGADAFVRKPFAADDLLRLVERITRRAVVDEPRPVL